MTIACKSESVTFLNSYLRLPIRLGRPRQLRLEAFNVFNHAQFDGPADVNGNIGITNFGQIVSATAPRLIQVAAKFSF